GADLDPARAVGAHRHLAAPEPRKLLAVARPREAVGEAPAASAALEREDEARALGRPAVDARPEAEVAVIAVERGHALRIEGELGVPHERAVAEDPDLAIARVGREHLLERALQGFAREALGLQAFHVERGDPRHGARREIFQPSGARV